MKKIELILVENSQNEFDYKIKKLEEAKKRILELEQDPIMKEYYELKKFVENNNEETLKKQRDKEINKIILYTTESNNVLYDYGSVFVNTYEGYDSSEDEFSIMHVYRDIETTEYYFEMIDEIELMPPGWNVGYSECDKEYEKIRKYFVEQIQSKSQEEVICELLKKDKKLIKGK